MGCGAKCFLRNWVLWILIAVALAGLALAGFFALQPCEPTVVETIVEHTEMVTIETEIIVQSLGALDLVFVIDDSGSVDDTEWQLEMDGAAAFLSAMLNQYNGTEHLFRAAMIEFASDTFVTFPFAPNETAVDLLASIQTHTRTISGGTDTNEALDAARLHLDEWSTDGQFRFVVVISDGASSSATSSLEAAGLLQTDNTTVAGIMVGTDNANQRELFSMTSCTPADQSVVVDQATFEAGVNCTYFVPAESFDAIVTSANTIATTIEVPTTATVETVQEQIAETIEETEFTTTCVEPEYLGFLALLLPLIFYLLIMPLIHACRQKFCPPPPPAAADPAAKGSADGDKTGATEGKKWKTVQTGGYLWSMSGGGAALVEVNFGDKAPPSAPQAQLNEAALKRVKNRRVSNAVAEVYGGQAQVSVSQYVCCCCWMCLSEADKAELRGEAPPTKSVEMDKTKGKTTEV